MTIYCHTHTATSRRYIGLTRQTMATRWRQHLSQVGEARKAKSHWYSALRKYGKDAFSHEVLERCETIEAARLAEIRWIQFYDTTNPAKGFNASHGGETGPAWSTVTLARQSERMRAQWADPAWVETIRAKWRSPDGVKRRSRAGAAAHLADRQRAKTHCPHGHEYTTENTRLVSGGARQCRTCIRARARAKRDLTRQRKFAPRPNRSKQ